MARTADEAAKEIKAFIPILQNAKDREINEADTRSIIHKFLSDVLGYDFINDITKEYAIRGTFADLGVLVDQKLKFMVEAKEIGTKLKDIHIRQAVGYAVNKGCNWCVLTDSVVWRLYRIEFKQPVEHIQVFEIDLLGLPPGDSASLIWLLSKTSMRKGDIDAFWQKRQCLNEANILKAVFSAPALKIIRREIRGATGMLLPLDEVAESVQGVLSEKASDMIDEGLVKIGSKKPRRRKRAITDNPELATPTPSPSELTVAAQATAGQT